MDDCGRNTSCSATQRSSKKVEFECEFTQPALRLDTVVGVPRAAVECLTWISDEVCLDGEG